MGLRPDRAVIVYSNLIRQTYKKTPIILGGIDISIGSVVGLSGVISAMVVKAGAPLPVGFLCGILAGTLVGVIIGILVTKECSIGILTLIALRRTHSVYSAGWYGKLCTVLIYLSMFVLMLWRNPNPTFVLVDCIAICCAVTLSFCKYFHYFMGILRENRRQKDSEKA